ncbi:hypothetical protein PAMP_003925 [Pampus punctatissimus]
MALPDRKLLQAINRIAESLGSGECNRLLYLCGHGHNLDTEDNACVKEMLESKVMSYENGYLFLAELMLQLKRYDILRKVFSTSRDEVESTLKYKEVLPRFRVLMAHISEDMANEDLRSVKFLLGSMLPREKLDKAKNFLDIITELEKLDKVSSEKVDLIEECLRNIGRVDLAKKVIVYKTPVVTSEQRSCQQQRHSHRVPFPSFTPNSSQSPQQTRLGQSLHIARENISVPLYRKQNYQIGPLDSYNFNSDPRGVCVIIDCVGNDGEGFSDREGPIEAMALSVASLAVVRPVISSLQTRKGQVYVLTWSDVFSLRMHAPFWLADPNSSLSRGIVSGFSPVAVRSIGMRIWRQMGVMGCPGLNYCLFSDSKTHLVDVHIDVNRAIYEHNNRNPEEKYHIDVKHTLRKELCLQ